MSTPISANCGWAPASDALYTAYHDTQWGVPCADGLALWESLMLEGQQAGLSWITILRKRETYRTAYARFDPDQIARFGPEDIARLLADPGVIRGRAKIEALIKGAQVYCDLREQGVDFAHFVWGFVDGRPIRNQVVSYRQAPGQTAISQKLSKELKALGIKFVGPTIAYAFMQASGLVNDHEITCPRWAICDQLAAEFELLPSGKAILN